MDKMDEILQEIIDRKKEIEPVTYVPAGTRIIIYPMTDLWLRTTKDIDKKSRSVAGNNSVSGLVGKRNTSVEQGNTGGSTQQVITSTSNKNQETQHQNAPLVGSSNNNAQVQQQRRVRALPPPSADGSDIVVPEESEEDDEGEIDLSF